MSQRTRLVVTAVVAVIVTLVATRFAESRVAAQTGVTICSNKIAMGPNYATNVQTWMAQQIQSGRKGFVSIGDTICSW